MSLSYDIVSDEPKEFIENPLGTIHIRAKNPHLGLIDSQASLNQFTEAFREALQKINRTFPKVRRVHLFFAGQPTLAFRCGQQINRNIDPETVSYTHLDVYKRQV